MALKIQKLDKHFPNGKHALCDIHLDIGDGEMVALIGASGSGKSTLLRMIAGLLPADSNAGSLIEVNGKCVQKDGRIAKDIRAIRAQVGFVFQQFNLVNRLPVITNVLIGLLSETPWWRSLLMRFTTEQRQKALEALASVGIEQTAWQRASTLSGGQQQRAALARCLVQKAKIILADEPIASLDPESSRKVMELLLQMNQVQKCTILVSLHQVEFAIRYCPRTIALNAGRVVYDGPSAALTPQLLAELYGSSAHELFQSHTSDSLSPENATTVGNVALI
jgi:phosphonate transport system ATP-binding protein